MSAPAIHTSRMAATDCRAVAKVNLLRGRSSAAAAAARDAEVAMSRSK